MPAGGFAGADTVLAPQPEALEVPGPEVDLPVIEPVSFDAPAATTVATQWLSFDPVEAELSRDRG